MAKAPPGVHPKWISHFPDGTYVDDDGTDEDAGWGIEDLRTFIYRDEKGSQQEGTYVQQDFRDVLKDLGF